MHHQHHRPAPPRSPIQYSKLQRDAGQGQGGSGGANEAAASWGSGGGGAAAGAAGPPIELRLHASSNFPLKGCPAMQSKRPSGRNDHHTLILHARNRVMQVPHAAVGLRMHLRRLPACMPACFRPMHLACRTPLPLPLPPQRA